MNKANYPPIALAIGAALLFILTQFGSTGEDSPIPLLTMLLMAEFTVIVTAAGVYLGGRALLEQGINTKRLLITLGCLAVAVIAAVKGLELWALVNSN